MSALSPLSNGRAVLSSRDCPGHAHVTPICKDGRDFVVGDNTSRRAWNVFFCPIRGHLFERESAPLNHAFNRADEICVFRADDIWKSEEKK